MKVQPIKQPMRGEHVLAVSPPLSASQNSDWLRRIRYYPGRTLSDTALITEQEERAGRLALLGRTQTAGVVEGLVVQLEPDRRMGEAPAGPAAGWSFSVGAGRGLTIRGEDVVVERPVRIPVAEVPVYAPVSVVAPDSAAAPMSAPDLMPHGVWPYRMRGQAFGEFVAGPPEEERWPGIPTAGILVLEPVTVELAGNYDPDDSCEIDPSAAAFADWQQLDGVQLVLYPWPVEWMMLPVQGTDARQWRNRLAYAVYDAERKIGPRRWLPWSDVGVPVGLVGFDGAPAWTPRFVDRFSVVRQGGEARPRTTPVRNAGQPGLWQARIQQFFEQLADLADERDEHPGTAFRYLPPAGLLPKSAIDLQGWQSGFFPASYRIQIALAPLEQLDVAITESASLKAYDTTIPDQVQVLVPVPQQWYEPRLLVREQIDPVFGRTITVLEGRRANALGKRINLWSKRHSLATAIFGTAQADRDVPAVPDDPQRLDPVEAFLPAFLDRLDNMAVGALRRIDSSGPARFEVIDDASTIAVEGENAVLYAWLYFDDLDAPEGVTVEWFDGDAWQRATWGDDPSSVNWSQLPAFVSALDTLSLADLRQRRIGPRFDLRLTVPAATITRLDRGLRQSIPERGRWLRLEVPASAVGLSGKPVKGVALTVTGGRAALGPLGLKAAENEPVWFTDQLRAKAQLPAADAGAVAGWDWALGTELLAPFSDPLETTVALSGNAEQRTVRPVTELVAALRSIAPFLAPPAAEAGAAGENKRWEDFGASLYTQGLEKYLQSLEAKIRKTDDMIDLSFLRVQTDIYRIHQLVAGSTSASRLVTSPVLASIAKSESAVVTNEQLETVYQALKDKEVHPSQDPPDSDAAWARGQPFAAAFAGSTITSSVDWSAAVGEPRTVKAKPVPASPAVTIAFGAQPTGFESASLNVTEVRATDASLFEVERPSGGPTVELGRLDETTVVSPFTSAAGAGGSVSHVVSQLTGESRLVAGIADRIDAVPILGQVPVPVDETVVRTTTLVERLEVPKAPEARSYAKSSKFDVFNAMTDLDIDLSGVHVALKPEPEEGGEIPAGTYVPIDFGAELIASPDTFKEKLVSGVLEDNALLDQDSNEAVYLANGVQLLEHTIAALRGVEARAMEYRRAIAEVRTTLNRVRNAFAAAAQRLQPVEVELGEARHDIAVARSLRADEAARVSAINDRRRVILERHVPFFAYYRPRATDGIAEVPARTLDPVEVEAAVPACLEQAAQVPAELRAMIDIVRQAPAAWFRRGPAIIGRLDQPWMLVEAVRQAKTRAQVKVATTTRISSTLSAPALAAILPVFDARAGAVAQVQAQTLRVDLTGLADQNWQVAQHTAQTVVNLGDLIDAPGGRSDIAHLASQELDAFAGVAGCLYAAFAQTAPALRLEWAQRLSQYDGPANLRNLSSLPRWGTIPLTERRTMQEYVDWLFQQIDDRYTEAVALVNDVIRVCLLLASFAPVARIIAGRVARPKIVGIGDILDLTAFELPKVRAGMGIRVFAGEQVVASGVVEDIGKELVAARVLKVTPAGPDPAPDEREHRISLDQTMHVQFTDDALISQVAAGAPLLGQALARQANR